MFAVQLSWLSPRKKPRVHPQPGHPFLLWRPSHTPNEGGVYPKNPSDRLLRTIKS